MKKYLFEGSGKTPLHRHSREGGSPEGFEKTGFPLPRESHYRMVKEFFSTLLGITFIFLFPLSLWGQPPDPSPEQIITIIFSSNVHGEVEPCG